MRRGRPEGSEIRNNLSVIINRLGCSYGYELYKIYKQVFGDVKLRNIYYNLKKGVNKGNFVFIDIKRELGNYTWGAETERAYYAPGPYISQKELTPEQERILQKYSTRKINKDWIIEVQDLTNKLIKEVRLFQEQKNSMSNLEKNKLNKKLLQKCVKLKEWSKDKLKEREYLVLLKKINELILSLD